MNLQLITSAAVPFLQLQDTGNSALALMEENNLSQLPLVTNDVFVALVQESDLLDWHTPEEPLEHAAFLTFKPAISALGHPFEAMLLMHDMNLNVLPVIDGEHKYLGCITRDGLLKYITENSGINTPGGILVLEIAPRNYTLVEIARICENEDVIIMNAQVHPNETGMLQVTLKLNRSALDAVVSSFERHGYLVREEYGEVIDNDDISGKYNLLMNYINM